MVRWNDESFLEVVEELAEWEGWISSESELSKCFDESIEEQEEQESMTPTDIRCAFADYLDRMYSDGQIHPEQAANYSYEGKYET